MSKKYGYCRISTKKQSIERQVRNITAKYPDAVIIKETYTGTKFQGRKEFDKILSKIQPHDTIIFDAVARMSRNSAEGYALYEELYMKDVNLIFLKEPHINTDVFKQTLQSQIEMTGGDVDIILEAVNRYLLKLARKQIQIAFDQAEKEVTDLRKRTSEGLVTARLNGKQIGQAKGTKLTTKKSIDAKEKIRKYNKDFAGSLTNEETWTLIGISKMSFYKYKRELFEELTNEQEYKYAN